MASGKVVVIGAVLAHTGTFRANQIVDNTGLSRQLVFKHLSNLTDTGLVEKTGHVYCVIDKQRLLNALIESTDNVEGQRLQKTIFWDDESNTKIKRMSLRIVRARALGVSNSLDMKLEMLKQLDHAIQSLRNEKKWLTNAVITEKSAANRIYKNDEYEDMGKLWDMMSQLLESLSCSRSEYVQEIETRVEEIRSEND